MNKMTEEQIERCVESRTNSFDNMLMKGRLTQVEYDAKMKELNTWSNQAYKMNETQARLALYSF